MLAVFHAIHHRIFTVAVIAVLTVGCLPAATDGVRPSAAALFGHPDSRAIPFGGYRGLRRGESPTVAHFVDGVILLAAMGLRFLRTYTPSPCPPTQS